MQRRRQLGRQTDPASIETGGERLAGTGVCGQRFKDRGAIGSIDRKEEGRGPGDIRRDRHRCEVFAGLWRGAVGPGGAGPE